MHLKPHALGLSGGLVTAIGYVLCSAWYALDQVSAVKFFGYILHKFNLAQIAGTGLDWGSFFAGLVAWFVMTYVSLWVTAWLYNKLLKQA